MNFEKIKNNFLRLKKEVEKFSREVEIVVVTKYVCDISIIAKLRDLGIEKIAENYVQEMVYKYKELRNIGFNVESYSWHFIGHLQRNKVKKIIGITSLIQSLDSIELAEKINQEAKNINKIQHCLLELKVSEEKSKFGVEEKNFYNFFEKINSLNLSNIKIVGIMSMAPYFENPELSRPYFKKTYKIFEEIKKSYFDFKIISMGMSNDYMVALQEGSNMIRIGSLIFKN